jgi:hypothetical protein
MSSQTAARKRAYCLVDDSASVHFKFGLARGFEFYKLDKSQLILDSRANISTYP